MRSISMYRMAGTWGDLCNFHHNLRRVDIEKIVPLPLYEYQENFSPKEWKEWESVNHSTDPLATFFPLWIQKESLSSIRVGYARAVESCGVLSGASAHRTGTTYTGYFHALQCHICSVGMGGAMDLQCLNIQ